MIVAPGRLLYRRDQPDNSTHGWQAFRFSKMLDGRRASRSKFFSDSDWGGRDGAEVMATRWVLAARAPYTRKVTP